MARLGLARSGVVWLLLVSACFDKEEGGSPSDHPGDTPDTGDTHDSGGSPDTGDTADTGGSPDTDDVIDPAAATVSQRETLTFYRTGRDGTREAVQLLAAGWSSDALPSYLVAAPEGDLVAVREITREDGTTETIEEQVPADRSGEGTDPATSGTTGELYYSWVREEADGWRRWTSQVSAEGHTWPDLAYNETACDEDACQATVSVTAETGEMRWLALAQDSSGKSDSLTMETSWLRPPWDPCVEWVDLGGELTQVSSCIQSAEGSIGSDSEWEDPHAPGVFRRAATASDTPTELFSLHGTLRFGGASYTDTLLAMSARGGEVSIADQGANLCDGRDLCAVTGASPVVYAYVEGGALFVQVGDQSTEVALPDGASVTALHAVRDADTAEEVAFVAGLSYPDGATDPGEELFSFRVSKNTVGPIRPPLFVKKNVGGLIWSQRVTDAVTGEQYDVTGIDQGDGTFTYVVLDLQAPDKSVTFDASDAPLPGRVPDITLSDGTLRLNLAKNVWVGIAKDGL